VTSCNSLDPSGSEDAVAFCAHHWSAAGAAADGSWALCGGAFTCEKNGKCFGECVDRDGFDAGYGSCSTYASNIRNSNYVRPLAAPAPEYQWSQNLTLRPSTAAGPLFGSRVLSPV